LRFPALHSRLLQRQISEVGFSGHALWSYGAW